MVARSMIDISMGSPLANLSIAAAAELTTSGSIPQASAWRLSSRLTVGLSSTMSTRRPASRGSLR